MMRYCRFALYQAGKSRVKHYHGAVRHFLTAPPRLQHKSVRLCFGAAFARGFGGRGGRIVQSGTGTGSRSKPRSNTSSIHCTA
uniref:Uncharacterized protein n=1 Tax=Conchiformibius kuhniae TaxID=211502 RepID=A0A8T9MZ49_9NEIS|nr:hypothetical protein LVJ77_04055 [Conchiformibius kuhniae]